MATLTHLLRPEDFAKLSEQDLAKLGQVIDSELTASPEIRERLKARIAAYLPHLESLQRGKN